MAFEIDMKDARIYLRDGSAVQAPETTGITDGISAAGQNKIDLVTGGVAAAGIEIGDWVADGATLRPRYFVIDIDDDEITLHKNLEAEVADETRLWVSDPNQVEVEIGEGNLTYSEKMPHEYPLSRGRLSRAKRGDEEPMDVSFDLIWDYITSVGEASPRDAIKRKNAASSWVSTGGECQPYGIDLVLDHKPDCATLDKPNELMIFPEFRANSIDGDLSSSQLSVPGQSLALEPIGIRYSNPE